MDHATELAGLPTRLRAVMAHVADKKDTRTQARAKFATHWCDSNTSNLSEWLRFAHLPRVPNMISLCEKTGLTLDWIYRGIMPPDGRKLRPLVEALELRIQEGEIY